MAAAPILQELVTELMDNLLGESIPPPSNQRAVTLLNRAKDQLVSAVSLQANDLFVARKTYTVAAADASIALPDGSGADAQFRQLVELRRTDVTPDQQCVIVDSRDAINYVPLPTPGSAATNWPRDPPHLYIEGYTAYFVNESGAPSGMTLVLRYKYRVADLAESALSSAYAGLPGDMARAVVMLATALAVPASSPAYGKFKAMYAEELDLVFKSAGNRNTNEPRAIRFVW